MNPIITDAVLAVGAAHAALGAFCLWRFHDVHGRWPFTVPKPPVKLAEVIPLPQARRLALESPEPKEG